MKKLAYRITIFFFFLVLITNQALAQTPYYLKTDKLTVEGTSTLHDWESEVTKVDWSGQFVIENNKLISVASARVTIPVTSIKSDKGRIMDNKTYEAFNNEKYPNITFQLTEATIKGDEIKAKGTLSMAGNSKTIEMIAKTKVAGSGEVMITGSYKINMRDYKMEPPTAVMGTIKVGEEVTVNFDLTLTTTKMTATK